jgi:hypothetical protein
MLAAGLAGSCDRGRPAHRPSNMRATASASFLFINNLIGIGFGTWFSSATHVLIG